MVWRHLKLTGPARPGLDSVCLSSTEAVTRSLTFTSHNHSTSSGLPVTHSPSPLLLPSVTEPIASSHHCVTLQLHCTCSVSSAALVLTLTSAYKLLESARDHLSVQQVSPSSLHASQKITEWNRTIRDDGRGVCC